MFSFSDSIEIKAPLERVYEILLDFNNYRKFYPPELKKIKIFSVTDTRAEVNYTISTILSDINYTLEYKLTPNKSLKWKLIDGSALTKDSGTWELTAINNNLTRAELKYKMDFAFYVPSSAIESRLEKGSPKMLSKLKKLAEKKEE